jgi:tetratricopeptide (TPR) repeat protein
MPRDAQGLTITAASEAAARAYDATLAAYCGLRRDAGDCLKQLLAADPEMVMAHVLRGAFMQLFATKKATARATQSLEAARALPANPREEIHREALARWIGGDLAGAVLAWQRILATHLRDLLALKLIHYANFYLGDAPAMRRESERMLPYWGDAVPGYGYLLGGHAFALEETGDYAAAERTARRAVALQPGDIWAAHAVAHVCEMEDRVEDGLAWIGAQELNWREANNFVFHVFWHRCLFLLALERADEALTLYDREVRAESTDDYLDITNAVGLLWRLEQAGIDVGARWSELAARSRDHTDDHALVFADVHYVMALAASGEAADVARWLASSRAHAETNSDTAARVMSDIGLALGEAALAHRRGDFSRVVELLMPRREKIRQIGGSHAQRDLFAQMLIDAARKSAPDMARGLLGERLAARPKNHWGLRQLG